MGSEIVDQKNETEIVDRKNDKSFITGLSVAQNAELYKYCEKFVASGLCPQRLANKRDECYIVMTYGMSLGLTPQASAFFIASINGNPQVYGDGVLMLATKHKEYAGFDMDYDMSDPELKCTIVMHRKGHKDFKSTYSRADAIADGQMNKPVWKAHLKKMIWRRALGNACKMQFPEIFLGVNVNEAETDSEFEGIKKDIETPTEQPKKESIAEITKRKALEDFKKEKEQKEQKIKEAEQVDGQVDATEQPQPAQTETVADKPVEETWLSKHCKHIDAHVNDESYLYKLLEKYEALPTKSERYSEDDRKKVIDKVQTLIKAKQTSAAKQASAKEKEGMF